MSAGAVFNIITNDGKIDKMILATDLLELVMSEIKKRNTENALRKGLDV